MRFRPNPSLLLLSLALIAPDALAWSNPGHRMVGELAQRHLTLAASAQVAQLLAGEAEPSLAGVSSWADELRRSNPESYKKTESWHYVNFPAGICTYVAKRDCPDDECVVAQIEKQRAILADRTLSLAKRRDALKFLVHFVADVHQPLHASNRRDRGGNDYQISLRIDVPPGKYLPANYVDGVLGTNLHSVWDYQILASQNLSPALYTDRLAALPWPPANSALPATWASESCKLIGAQHLYPKGHKLDRISLDKQRPLAEQQVRIAARRLADLLNQALAN